MIEKNYELIKFYGNWADELNIYSFSIKPKGYIKEVFKILEEYFKNNNELSFYCGSNQKLIFENLEEVSENFVVTEITEEDSNTLKNLFDLNNTFTFNFNILYSLISYSVDDSSSNMDSNFFNEKDFPITYSSYCEE